MWFINGRTDMNSIVAYLWIHNNIVNSYTMYAGVGQTFSSIMYGSTLLEQCTVSVYIYEYITKNHSLNSSYMSIASYYLVLLRRNTFIHHLQCHLHHWLLLCLGILHHSRSKTLYKKGLTQCTDIWNLVYILHLNNKDESSL